MQEIGKFDVKVNVILNGIEKYMGFTINNNLLFVDSMQFVNSSLHALVKNLSDNEFKYSLQKFSGDLLELVKQKGMYPYKYINNFKMLFENKLPNRCECFRSVKKSALVKKIIHMLLMFGMCLK